jgi:mannitol/fructose-specific phosphotransferase system IIA component (Ntr-type)
VNSALPDLHAFLHPSRVVSLASDLTKAQAIHSLADSFRDLPTLTNHRDWIKALFDREDVTSTGIGGGVALPHAQHQSVSTFALAIGRAPNGIAFSAKDDRPVRLFIMMAAPLGDRPTYLKVLAGIAARLHRPPVVERILLAASPTDAIDAFLHG